MPVQLEKEINQKDEQNLELLTQSILAPQHNYCDIACLMKKFQDQQVLSNKALALKDVTGKLSTVAIMVLLAGIIYGVNAPNYSHHVNMLIGVMSFILGLFPSCIVFTGLVTVDGRELPQFNWINKLLCKMPRFKNRQKDFEQFRDNLYASLTRDEFKHDYLTHVQYKIMQYQQLLKLLSNEDEQYHFDDIESLKEAIMNLKRQQSVIVKTMVDNEASLIIKQIQMTESMFVDVDDMVKEQDNIMSQKTFIEKHKAVLEKKGLSQIIDATNAQWQNALPPEQKLESYL